jgi:hypothetical protein
MITIQVSQRLIIRDRNIYFNNCGIITTKKIDVKDIDKWIYTKSLNGTPIKEPNILKLRQLKTKMTKNYTIPKSISIKKESPVQEMIINIVKNPTIHISINNCIFLTPVEFANLIYKIHKGSDTKNLKYILKKHIIPASKSENVKIVINHKEIKKAYQLLIGMGIKIPIYLKSEIDAIYRWQ